MIILTTTTDALQIKLEGAITTNELPILSMYRDSSASDFVPGRSLVTTNGATDVAFVPAPAASTQRIIDFICVTNIDTVSHVVTIKYDANGTEFILKELSLGVGESIEYNNDYGWKVYGNNGAVKTSLNQGTSPASSTLNVAIQPTDVVNNNAVANTIADVTGLSFPVVAGNRYYFKFVIDFTSAINTTGSRWAVSGPSLTRLTMVSNYTLAATTQTLNSGVAAYDTPAASSASSLVAGGLAVLEGFIQCSADGDVIARFASEIANSAITAKAGSLVQWLQIS